MSLGGYCTWTTGRWLPGAPRLQYMMNFSSSPRPPTPAASSPCTPTSQVHSVPLHMLTRASLVCALSGSVCLGTAACNYPTLPSPLLSPHTHTELSPLHVDRPHTLDETVRRVERGSKIVTAISRDIRVILQVSSCSLFTKVFTPEPIYL